MASCYPKEVQGFSAEVSDLLEEQAAALDSATRLALVSDWMCLGSPSAHVVETRQSNAAPLGTFRMP